jgi:hypothetical protein
MGVQNIAVKPWGPVQRLLPVVGTGTERVVETVREIGLESTVDALVDELALRFVPPAIDLECRFQLDVG